MTPKRPIIKKIYLPLFITTFFYLLPSNVFADDFEKWKKAYAQRASKRGLPQGFVLEILDNINVDHDVIKKDKNQILSDETFDYKAFIKDWLRNDKSRLAKAKEALKDNYSLLDRIEKKYRVNKEIIVALWGVETFYGKITGDHDVIRSLATLAYEGRRRRFYEIQLNAALRLIKKGHVESKDLVGSWAGATGQCQFMPSNIPVYGQDFNNDGKIDIWNSKADIFASIAYFLKKAGWKYNHSVGSLALNTQGYEGPLDTLRRQDRYNELGFRTLNGNHIQSHKWSARKASAIPMKNSPVVLRGSNYYPLMKWNRSSLFAALNILILNSLKNS